MVRVMESFLNVTVGEIEWKNAETGPSLGCSQAEEQCHLFCGSGGGCRRHCCAECMHGGSDFLLNIDVSK